MIINFTRKYQFATRLHMNQTLLDCINETPLLGLILTDNLCMKKNTNNLVKKGYQRMAILRKLYGFSIPIEDLVQIYCLFVRSILEFNSCVWFSMITEEEKEDLERVQRVACKIILKGQYSSYMEALETLKLQDLNTRRIQMAKKMGQKCVNNSKMKDIFKQNSDIHMDTRSREKYHINFANNERLKKSPVIAIQKLLNEPE